MEPPIPCQDAGRSGILSNGWHVLIVSDGAGSSSHSHIASDFCVSRLHTLLEEADLTTVSTAVEADMLTSEDWHRWIVALFGQTREGLLRMGEAHGYRPEQLHCTLLLVIRTPRAFLCAHVGDGRAGYFDGSPKPLMVPFMTFTAGATYFLVKEGWDLVFRASVNKPERPAELAYYFVSTDGCQNYIIDHTRKGPKTGMYDDILGDEAFYDFNMPYHPFFQGLILSLKEVDTQEQINERLQRLVATGVYVCNGEEKELKSISDLALDDDKTLLFAFKHS